MLVVVDYNDSIPTGLGGLQFLDHISSQRLEVSRRRTYIDAIADPSSCLTGLQDLVRVITRPDKAPAEEDAEILGDDMEDEGDEDEEDEEDESDEELDAAEGTEAVDEEAERPVGMEIDNGAPSTSDQVTCLFRNAGKWNIDILALHTEFKCIYSHGIHD